MRVQRPVTTLAAIALLSGILYTAAAPAMADEVIDRDGDAKSPKQLNDPLPPGEMPKTTPPRAVPTPRGTPEGMGNETDFSKTPGDDDPSDGVDEEGRDPVPGMPREAPGIDKRAGEAATGR
jgi:hypothetical protein